MAATPAFDALCRRPTAAAPIKRLTSQCAMERLKAAVLGPGA